MAFGKRNCLCIKTIRYNRTTIISRFSTNFHPQEAQKNKRNP